MDTKFSPSRVIYLTPYSKTGPVHGGKIRADQISKILVGIDPLSETIALGDRDFKSRPSTFELDGVSRALVGDLEMFERNYALSERGYSNLKVVVFEQPWSWNEVKELKKRYPDVKIIYSSQNIECQLKGMILSKYLGDRANSIAREIRNIEIEIASSVDRVIVVSELDKDWYSQFTKHAPILAPNGAVKRNHNSSDSSIKEINSALVVGSSHPPNIEGCLKFLSDPELWMPRDSEIVVAGSLAVALSEHWGNLRNRWGETCVKLIPEVNDSDLGLLLEQSNVIVLPIAYGGGTNLKSAEALVSGRPIVASIQAFRGFEDYTNDPTVKIAHSNMEFKILTAARLISGRIPNKERDISKLLWNSTLRKLETSVRELIHD